MPGYSGLLVRDNFGDSGQIPTAGNVWGSPDIIPYQNSVLSPAEASSTYSRDIGRPVVGNSVNHVYVRCRNTAQAPAGGSVKLYYSEASLLLTPDSWKCVNQPGEQVDFIDCAKPSSLAVPVGGYGFTQSPFNMEIHAAGHYCFIAVVSGPDRPPNVPQEFHTNEEYSQWVRENPFVAWRNILLIPGSRSSMATFLRFGNANPTPADLVFFIEGENTIDGTTYEMSCVDTRLPGGSFKRSGVLLPDGSASILLKDAPPGISGDRMMSMGFVLTAPGGQVFRGTAGVSFYEKPKSVRASDLDGVQHPLRSEAVGAAASLIPLGSVRVVAV